MGIIRAILQSLTEITITDLVILKISIEISRIIFAATTTIVIVTVTMSIHNSVVEASVIAKVLTVIEKHRDHTGRAHGPYSVLSGRHVRTPDLAKCCCVSS